MMRPGVPVLGALLIAAAHAFFLPGCAQDSCTQNSNVAGLLLPPSPPSSNFSLFQPQRQRPASPGCISNGPTIMCSSFVSNGSLAGTWGGSTFLASSGALLYHGALPPIEYCVSDASPSGSGRQLGIMDEAGSVVAWGPGGVAYVTSRGAKLWEHSLQPPSPCGASSHGALSSVTLSSTSNLLFYREQGLVFSYYASGIPDATLTLLANSTSTTGSPQLGYLLPLTQASVDSRTLYIARFYRCRGGACTGNDPLSALVPTPALVLAAVDVRTGTPADPRRMVLPWDNAGPPIPSGSGNGISTCLPTTTTTTSSSSTRSSPAGSNSGIGGGREALLASATVLSNGATFIGLLQCSTAPAGNASGSQALRVFSFDVSGGQPVPQGKILWARDLEVPPASAYLSSSSFSSSPSSSSSTPSPWAPPALVQHPGGGVGLIWLVFSGGGDAHLVALNASTGAQVFATSVRALLTGSRGTPPPPSLCPLAARAGQGSAPPRGGDGLPLAVLPPLGLTAPPKGALLEGAGQEGALLLSLQVWGGGAATANAATGTGGGPQSASFWLLAVGLRRAGSEAALGAGVLWCTQVQEGGFEGQFTIAAAEAGSAKAGSIIGVSPTAQVWGLLF